MADTETPTSLVEHFDLIWKVCVAALLAIISLYARRFKTMEDNQKKVLRTIPTEALENGLLLVTCKDCALARDKCRNIIVIDELQQTLKVIKQAIVILVMNTDGIDKDDRDRIAKELIGD